MTPDHLLNQTCTISTAGAPDRFNKASFSAEVTWACRFQRTNRIMQTATAEKTPIDGVVTMSAKAVVAINDKLIFDGASYRVMMIAPGIDGQGQTRQLKLSVQKWNN